MEWRSAGSRRTSSARRPDVGLPAARIFTIGHSTHSLEEFVRLLVACGVAQVADVRRYPASRRLPWFNRDALARELHARELSYFHVAGLGGRRRPRAESRNGGWRVEAFRGYADHMAGAEFRAGLATLEKRARQLPTAVMCAEALWWRCHRRLVSDALTVHGWEVVHIGSAGDTTTHELTPFAVPGAGGLTYPPPQASLRVD